MEKIENIGYIYKITNLINNKCYIGQTTKSIEERWNQHKNDAFRKKRYTYNYPLYRAFRKYGFENFSFEVIEKCKISELNDKEIYWINFYNSYHNGYNQTLGGNGTKNLELNEQEVIEKYKEFQTLEKVAKFFNCSRNTINKILNKHNITITSAQDHAKQKAFTVYMLNDNHEVLKIFNSLREAGRWVFDQGLTKRSRELAHTRINDALYLEQKCYGYYWYCLEYSKEDKENYRNKKKIRDKRYNYKNHKKVYSNKQTNFNFCKICGSQISESAKICAKCHSQQNSNKAIKEKQEKGITREFLKQEIRNKSFTQIGKEQGVSDNAIRKWCKLYNLPSKSSEIKKYSDEEWKNI